MILPLFERGASSPTSIPSITVTSSSSPAVCGFEGNNDIYGIGIRIGIYAQMLAVWFANYFLLSEVQVLRDTVSIFGVAILIVTIIFASEPSSVHAVEAFILLQILAWSCIMGVRAKSSYTSAHWGRSVIRMVLNEAINLASLCLHVWFWCVGMDKMQRTPCGTYLRYVVKTDMYGWARKVMAGFSIFVLAATVYWCAVEVLRAWAIIQMKGVRVEFVKAIKMWEAAETQDHERADSSDLVQGSENVDNNDAAEEQADSREGCSQDCYSGCSPTRSDLELDQGTTSVDRSQTPATQFSEPSERPDSGSLSEVPTAMQITTYPPSVSAPADRPSDPASSILDQVYESELYIQHCVAASPFQSTSNKKPQTLLALIKSIVSSRKHGASGTTDAQRPPSWLRCHINIWKTFLTFQFPRQSFIIYGHLRQARLLDPLNGPYQTYASLNYTSSSGSLTRSLQLPPWPCVSLASTLLLTSSSTPKKIHLAWYYALIDLSIHILVITQLELTLVWNHVSGLTGLTSVGQLIPFVIGVGGLGLVGSRWVGRLWRKGHRSFEDYEKNYENDRIEGSRDSGGSLLSPEVKEAYTRWKEVHEKESNKTKVTGS